MTISIENEHVIASFSTHGAELLSFKKKETDIEYIWQGNPEYWGRHTPVLFPIVGRLKDNQYEYQRKVYPMGQHGFARDMDFTVITHEADNIAFQLESNPDTLELYPFEFRLILSYELTGTGIVVYYQVENIGNSDMYFSIGGHPAFNVPLDGAGNFEDYYLHFSPQKSRITLPLKNGLIDEEAKTLGQTNTDIQFTRDLFADDALIYETKGLNSYSIRSDQTEHSVTLSYDNMPFVGIWSPYPKEAPFVCIEPWCGIADTVNASGKLDEKFGINHLSPNEKFTHKYCITVQ